MRSNPLGSYFGRKLDIGVCDTREEPNWTPSSKDSSFQRSVGSTIVRRMRILRDATPHHFGKQSRSGIEAEVMKYVYTMPEGLDSDADLAYRTLVHVAARRTFRGRGVREYFHPLPARQPLPVLSTRFNPSRLVLFIYRAFVSVY